MNIVSTLLAVSSTSNFYKLYGRNTGAPKEKTQRGASVVDDLKLKAQAKRERKSRKLRADYAAFVKHNPVGPKQRTPSKLNTQEN